MARFGEATPENNFKAKPDGKYAEVWMGTSHEHGPSSVILPDGKLQPLKDFILKDPEGVYGKAINRLTETAKKDGQVRSLTTRAFRKCTLTLLPSSDPVLVQDPDCWQDPASADSSFEKISVSLKCPSSLFCLI